jgi:HK97 family phage major capsid protein
MNTIPYERYQGRVFAFGAYGAPTIPLPSRRTMLIGLFVAVVAVLWFTGVIDHHGLVLAAGPVAVTGTASDLAKRLETERGEFQTWYKSQTDDDGHFTGDAKDFRKRNDAIGETLAAYEDARTVEDAIKANEAGIAELHAPVGRKVRGGDISPEIGSSPTERKTLGEMFIESPAYKNRGTGQTFGPQTVIDLDQVFGKGRGFKTIFDEAAAWSVQNVRLPEPITPGAQQPTVASLMPEGRTSQAAIAYMEETTTTSNAAETAESGTKPEAALAFTERTSAVRKIAVSLPVTDESLDDIPFIESYLNTRLSFFIVQREDSQLLNGNGTPPNLRGLLNVSGIGTQATSTDSNQDAILKAIVATQVASFLEPDAVVLHPNNWLTMRLAKDDVGNYLFGPPNMQGADQVFGYRTVRTTAIAAGTGLTGSFRGGAEVFRRTDLSMQVGWVNDQFVKNQRTILLEERLALVAFRPSAFTKITGLA